MHVKLLHPKQKKYPAESENYHHSTVTSIYNSCQCWRQVNFQVLMHWKNPAMYGLQTVQGDILLFRKIRVQKIRIKSLDVCLLVLSCIYGKQ